MQYDVAVFGALGRNLTQELANFNVLFTFSQISDIELSFVSKFNIVWLLHPGQHKIECPFGMKCGLIPLGSPCAHVKTQGLKWEIGKKKTHFVTNRVRWAAGLWKAY